MTILARVRRARAAIRRRLIVAGWMNVDARRVDVEGDVFYVRFLHGDRVLAMPVSEVRSVDCLLLPAGMGSDELNLKVCVNSTAGAFAACCIGTVGYEAVKARLRDVPGLWFDALCGAEMMIGAGRFSLSIYEATGAGR